MSERRRGAGAIAPEVRAEFPGLTLVWQTVEARPGPSPAAVRARLRGLADRATGARAVVLRTQPLGHAYRAFYRHIGLDPDVTRVPSEAAAVRRLLEGGLPSEGVVPDALTVAVLETGVPVWALAADRVDAASLEIRTSREGESAGDARLAGGELVVASAGRPLARLFGDVTEAFAPRIGTRAVTLFAVGVDGVPAMVVEEALWLAAEVLHTV